MSSKKDSRIIKGMDDTSYNKELLHIIQNDNLPLIKECDAYSNDVSEIAKVDTGDNTEKRKYTGNRL